MNVVECFKLMKQMFALFSVDNSSYLHKPVGHIQLLAGGACLVSARLLDFVCLVLFRLLSPNIEKVKPWPNITRSFSHQGLVFVGRQNANSAPWSCTLVRLRLSSACNICGADSFACDTRDIA